MTLKSSLLVGGLILLVFVLIVWVVPYFQREKPRPPGQASFAGAPPGVGEPAATDGYPERAHEGVPYPWRPEEMPVFEGPMNPDEPLSQLGRDSLGDWMGYADPWNPLKNLEDEVRPGASTWFRAARGWASFPGSYEGSSASSMSAYMVAT
jgi:hypothetical protein